MEKPEQGLHIFNLPLSICHLVRFARFARVLLEAREVEHRLRRAEANALVAIGEMQFDDVERRRDHAADAVDGVGPELAPATVERLAEPRVLTPVVERFRVDLYEFADAPEGLAHGEHFDS